MVTESDHQRDGASGEPGEPGNPPGGGGGQGGRGGQGARGEVGPRGHTLIWPLVVTAILIGAMLIATLVIVADVHNNTNGIKQLVQQNRHALVLAHESDLSQCRRLQEQRDSDNNNAWYLKQANLQLAVIIVEPGLLKVLGHRDQVERVRAAAQYRAVAEHILYEPPTNCEQATTDPHYRRPPPVPFPANFKPAG